MQTVLISGASVAGPALAYWLGRHGFQPTVVERAPALRGGGYAVDFRGDTHLTVLERMGVLADLRGVATGGTPITFVDDAGRELLRLPGEFAGGDIEVSRSDLSRVLYEHSRDSAEYVFGDSIATLTETAAGVDVTFTHGAPRTFDLVVGADGMHSAVRRIAFGAQERFVSHLGYYVAGWDLPASEDLGADTLAYNVPGRLASIGRNHRDPDRASAFVIFASRQRGHDPYDSDQQRRLIRDALAGMTWRIPELIASLDEAEDLYFDGISRVDISPWSHGRIALVGDAACGATLGGMGTGTAVVAAYILAGELTRGVGAFARYESALRDYARRCQRGGDRAGRFLAPKHRLSARIRNRALRSPRLLDMLLNEGRKVPARIDLPKYLHVRTAMPDDASAIAHVKVTGWSTTYRTRVPPAVLAPFLDAPRQTAALARRIDDADGVVLVAIRVHIVGFAACTGAAGPGEPLLDSLHVLPGERGQGVGAALLARLGAELGARGRTSLTLRVVADNHRARALYERLGAEHVATAPAAWAPLHALEAEYRWPDLGALRAGLS